METYTTYSMKEINQNFKIIFYNGGFAGDLITALYNPNIFKSFDNKSVVLDKDVVKLKSREMIGKNITDKINYLKSIEHLGICSSHDVELSLRLKHNTTFVHCSAPTLASFFYHRVKRDEDGQKMSLKEHINWQNINKKIYKNQIDVANINKKTFLSDLKINDSRSTDILKKWLELNKHD